MNSKEISKIEFILVKQTQKYYDNEYKRKI